MGKRGSVSGELRSLDARVAYELNRARRHGRPLSLFSISLEHAHTRSRFSRRASIEEIGHILAGAMRQTDALGVVDRGRLLALLPETSAAEARLLAGRLMNTLGRSAIRGVQVGVASFPDDAVTWVALKSLAEQREHPLPLVAMARGGSSDGEIEDAPPEASPFEEWPLKDGHKGRVVLTPRRRRPSQHVRRAVDFLVLLLVAPLALVLVAVLAIAVKLDSPGPTFVSHKRAGNGGKHFRVYKLRTMVKNAEDLKQELLHLNVLAWPDFKIPNDPRVTRVGRLLRRTSFDELPQLWNLLRGEITLIGPRACSVDVGEYQLWQTERLEVTPGLFGRWQAEGRGSADFAERCRMDIEEVRSRSIASQIGVALRTTKSIITGKGAS